jgi:hypothetical protein
MVTEEQCDAMYRACAADPQARSTRHAPSSGASTPQRTPPDRAAERLLFALPGTPVIY